MKIGVNCDISKAEFVKKCGYDYIEAKYWKLALMENSEYSALYDMIERADFPAYAWNGFFKPDFELYGENTDFDFIRAFAHTGFSRASRLGGKIAVFGCGGARKIPAGADVSVCRERLCEILNICGDIAEKYDISIAFEPLNFNETNFINTVAEGADICHETDNANVKLLADFYHIFMNKEDINDVSKARDILVHTHIARPNPDRRSLGDSDFDYCRECRNVLLRSGYDGAISLECKYGEDIEGDIAAAKRALEIFR